MATTTDMKNYRAFEYDISDETYAKSLGDLFKKCHTDLIQTKFNIFTENLMDEPKINRYCLLAAIDDYKKSEESRKYPLNSTFCDNAFNFRPHQCCVQ